MLESYTQVGDLDLLSVLSHHDDAVTSTGCALRRATVSAIFCVSAALGHRASLRSETDQLLVLIAAVPVGQGWLRWHVLGEFGHIARLVSVLEGVCNLHKLGLLVTLEHLQLRIHPIDQLLLLLV